MIERAVRVASMNWKGGRGSLPTLNGDVPWRGPYVHHSSIQLGTAAGTGIKSSSGQPRKNTGGMLPINRQKGMGTFYNP